MLPKAKPGSCHTRDSTDFWKLRAASCSPKVPSPKDCLALAPVPQGAATVCGDRVAYGKEPRGPVRKRVVSPVGKR